MALTEEEEKTKKLFHAAKDLQQFNFELSLIPNMGKYSLMLANMLLHKVLDEDDQDDWDEFLEKYDLEEKIFTLVTADEISILSSLEKISDCVDYLENKCGEYLSDKPDLSSKLMQLKTGLSTMIEDNNPAFFDITYQFYHPDNDPIFSALLNQTHALWQIKNKQGSTNQNLIDSISSVSTVYSLTSSTSSIMATQGPKITDQVFYDAIFKNHSPIDLDIDLLNPKEWLKDTLTQLNTLEDFDDISKLLQPEPFKLDFKKVLEPFLEKIQMKKPLSAFSSAEDKFLLEVGFDIKCKQLVLLGMLDDYVAQNKDIGLLTDVLDAHDHFPIMLNDGTYMSQTDQEDFSYAIKKFANDNDYMPLLQFLANDNNEDEFAIMNITKICVDHLKHKLNISQPAPQAAQTSASTKHGLGDRLEEHYEKGQGSEIIQILNDNNLLAPESLSYGPIAKNQATYDFEYIVLALLANNPSPKITVENDVCFVQVGNEKYNLNEMLNYVDFRLVSCTNLMDELYTKYVSNASKYVPRDPHGDQILTRVDFPNGGKGFGHMLFGEMAAVNIYTQNFYHTINTILHNKKDVADLGRDPDKLKEALIHSLFIGSALQKLPETKVDYAYRAEGGMPKEVIKSRIQSSHFSNVTVKETGFLSTSSDKPAFVPSQHIEHRVMFTQLIGWDVAGLSHYPNEREFLMAPTDMKYDTYIKTGKGHLGVGHPVRTPKAQQHMSLSAAQQEYVGEPSFTFIHLHLSQRKSIPEDIRTLSELLFSKKNVSNHEKLAILSLSIQDKIESLQSETLPNTRLINGLNEFMEEHSLKKYKLLEEDQRLKSYLQNIFDLDDLIPALEYFDDVINEELLGKMMIEIQVLQHKIINNESIEFDSIKLQLPNLSKMPIDVKQLIQVEMFKNQIRNTETFSELLNVIKNNNRLPMVEDIDTQEIEAILKKYESQKPPPIDTNYSVLLAKLPKEYGIYESAMEIINKDLGTNPLALLEDAMQFAFDNYLGKTYTNPSVQWDWELDCGPNQLLFRPNHGLAHSVKVANMIPYILTELKAVSNEYEHFNSLDVLKLQLAMLFSVAGRENDAGHSDDLETYKRSKKNTVDYFRDYVTKHLPNLYSAEELEQYCRALNDYTDPVHEEPMNVIMHFAHSFDMYRCKTQDEMQKWVPHFVEVLGQERANRIAQLSHDQNLAVGDRDFSKKINYNHQLFYQNSTKPATLIMSLQSVEKPSPKKLFTSTLNSIDNFDDLRQLISGTTFVNDKGQIVSTHEIEAEVKAIGAGIIRLNESKHNQLIKDYKIDVKLAELMKKAPQIKMDARATLAPMYKTRLDMPKPKSEKGTEVGVSAPSPKSHK